MSSDAYYQVIKYRDAELRRDAEQHRQVREAVERRNQESGTEKGGAFAATLRGVRRARREASATPSGC